MLYIWGALGIIAAVAITVWIGFMLYAAEKNKQRNKEMVCAVSGHDLDGCLCKRCGREEHDWDGCVCARCNKKRNEEHDWHRCLCIKCGAKRDEQHDWAMENDDENAELKMCKICGKIESPEYDEEDEE